MSFARLGHDAGYPTADLESRLVDLATALGLSGAQVSATPTVIEVSIGALPRQQTYTLRVRPGGSDLDTLAQLDRLADEVEDGALAPGDALVELQSLAAGSPGRAWPVLLAAYALAGAALTPVLGGGWREAIAAAAVGLAVGLVALASRRLRRAEALVAPLAALVASFLATVMVKAGVGVSPDIVTLAALVTFLPGMKLTVGMQELSTEHLQSGVANTANALVQLLGLVFGVGVGRSIAENWFGATRHVAPHVSIWGIHLIAAAAAGLAFTVTLRARTRDAPVMCAATVLALLASEAGTHAFGPQAGAFVAALTIGVVGGFCAPYLRRSSLVFIVPGVLMLVPGSAGFNSALQLLGNHTVSGITSAFDTFITALAISYGLIVAAVVVPEGFTGFRRRRPA